MKISLLCSCVYFARLSTFCCASLASNPPRPSTLMPDERRAEVDVDCPAAVVVTDAAATCAADRAVVVRSSRVHPAAVNNVATITPPAVAATAFATAV